MSNRISRRSPLSPSVYLANSSHSSATTFSNHTPAKGGTFSWQWPKWSCELDAFCDSAKKVIRNIGSVLQPDHDELAQFELDYFLRGGSGPSDGGAGIGASELQEYSEGVGDSESGGGYLSDVSLDSHGVPAQPLFIARRNHEVEVEVASYPPRRASPRFSEATDSTLEAAAYFIDGEYVLGDNEEEERHYEGRGRSSRREMARTLVAAPAPVEERRSSRSDKKEKSSHKDEDSEERERRRAERRKRKMEREERRAREAAEEREKEERKQEKHERRRQKEEKAQKVEVTIKEKSPKLIIEGYLNGLGGSRSRSMLGIRRGSTAVRSPDARPDARPDPRHDARPDVRHDARPDPRHDARSIVRPDRPDVQLVSRPDARPDARSVRSDARPDVRNDARSVVRSDRPDARPDARPGVRPDVRSDLRPDVRPKLTIKRSRSTVLMKAPEKAKESAKERHRHRDHHDHSTPQARADCLRCLRKREKKEKLEKITIVPLSRLHEEARAKAKVDRIEKADMRDTETVIGEREKSRDEVCSKKKAKPLEFVIGEKEKMIECVTCLADDIPVKEAAKLACGHYWCHDCLKRIFTLSLTDPAHMPPKCCTEEHVPLKHVDKLLNYQTKKLWNKKYIEYTTANRIYCPEPNCGEWIQPKEICGNIGKCSRCKTKVCSMCNGKAHGDGECPKDEDLLKFIEHAKKNKFQRCYSCRAMVELERGCNHMTCRCTAEFCYVCGDKWKTCKCPWFNYEPEEDDDYVIPEWNANDPGPVIPANILERREQRARARAEQMRQDEELARRLELEDAGAPSPTTVRGDIFSDEYYLPSPIQIDPLAALGTIGSGLRDGIRRIAADYVETATRATPQPRLERRRTASVSRATPRARSREEIRENISNLIQEVEELSGRSRSPQRPRYIRAETAPEVRTPALMEPRERSSVGPSRYLSGAQQALIQDYLRGIDLEDPEPVAPPLPSPHISSQSYEPAFPELRRSRTERLPRRRRGEHDFSAEYTDHTPLEVIDRIDRMSRIDTQSRLDTPSRFDTRSRLDTRSRVDTESRVGTESRVTEATFRERRPSVGSRAGLTAEHRWRYASQARMPVDASLGAWRWGAESRGY